MRWIGLLLACAVLACAGEDVARNPGARVLVHGPLRIEVMDPAAPDRYIRGVRFCPLAVVLRATIAGHELLYDPSEHDPVDDAAGLASEFDLCIPGGPAGDLPPGWATAAVGGGFLKIGVGMLAKGVQPYNLFQHPSLLVPAATTVAWRDDGATFVQICAGGDGFAYELHADLSLRDDGLAVAWRLANTGTRAFTTRHYVHNFLRFDDHDVGPGYVLTFPYPIAPTGLLPEQAASAQSIAFTARIPRWVNIEVPWPADYGGAAIVELAHPAAGLSVVCTTSVASIRTAIHARPQYVAPEQFVALTVAPGAACTWTRSWRFQVGR